MSTLALAVMRRRGAKAIAPVTPPGTLTVPLTVTRTDGGAGTARVWTPLPLPPGTLTAEQMGNVSLWVGGEEQRIAVSDPLARHPDDSVLVVWVEADLDVATGTDLSAEVRLGTPRATADIAGDGYATPAANPLTIVPDPDDARFYKMTTPGYYLHHNTGRVVGIPAQRLAWPSATTLVDGSDRRYQLGVAADGTVTLTQTSSRDNSPSGFNLASTLQVIGYVQILTTGADFTPGTTSLDAATIAKSYSRYTHAPMPPAVGIVTSVDFLCSTRLTGTPLVPRTTSTALGGSVAVIDGQFATEEPRKWRQYGGRSGFITGAQYDVGAPSLNAWCETGAVSSFLFGLGQAGDFTTRYAAPNNYVPPEQWAGVGPVALWYLLVGGTAYRTGCARMAAEYSWRALTENLLNSTPRIEARAISNCGWMNRLRYPAYKSTSRGAVAPDTGAFVVTDWLAMAGRVLARTLGTLYEDGAQRTNGYGPGHCAFVTNGVLNSAICEVLEWASPAQLSASAPGYVADATEFMDRTNAFMISDSMVSTSVGWGTRWAVIYQEGRTTPQSTELNGLIVWPLYVSGVLSGKPAYTDLAAAMYDSMRDGYWGGWKQFQEMTSWGRRYLYAAHGGGD